MKRYSRIRTAVVIMVAATAGIAVMAYRVRPVFAQDVVTRIIEFIKSKAGFVQEDRDGYMFSKDTPSYTALAGDAKNGGGHKVALLQDGVSIELSFLTASLTASVSGDIAGVSTGSAELLPQDAEKLAAALPILERAATDSAGITGATYVNESVITAAERLTLDAAYAVFSRVSTAAAEPRLTDEQRDFLLLVYLRSRKVSVLYADVNRKMAELQRDVSAVVSKAQLVENETERTVRFAGILPVTDMSYRLTENGMEQLIVITDRSDAKNSFSYALKPHGLTYTNMNNRGMWYFSDAFGPVFRIPRAYATDAGGKFTNDAEVAVTEVGGTRVTVTIDPVWLADPARAYPVTIHTALEVVPELRDGHPGAGELRARRKAANTAVPTALPNTVQPTAAALPVTTATPVPEATDSAAVQSAAAAVPATDSGTGTSSQ